MSGRVNIPVATITRTGILEGSSVASSSTNKHFITLNDGRTFLLIVSSDGADQTVSVEIATLVDGQGVTSKVISVPAGATILAGPFPVGSYNQLAIAAAGTLTSDTVNVANNDTVTIDATVYTFKTTLTGAAYEVHIGGSAAVSLANLKAAINDTGTEGTDYGTGTAAHTTVTAGALSATTLALSAITAGAAGDTIATTETSAHLSFGATTLINGFDAGALLIDPSISATLALRAYTLTS